MNTAVKPYDLETKVPHFGRIKAIKRGEMEYEYLLKKANVVTWLSHEDIKAMFFAQASPAGQGEEK